MHAKTQPVFRPQLEAPRSQLFMQPVFRSQLFQTSDFQHPASTTCINIEQSTHNNYTFFLISLYPTPGLIPSPQRKDV